MLWERPGAVGHDGLRQPARDGLAGQPRRRGLTARVGTLGMSMGSTMAWWLAALDERVQGDGGHQLPDRLLRPSSPHKGLRSARHLLLRARRSSKHFTTSQINALIAPRAHLGLAGLRDDAHAASTAWIASTAICSRCIPRSAMPSGGSCCATTSRIRRRRRGVRRSKRSSRSGSDRPTKGQDRRMSLLVPPAAGT